MPSVDALGVGEAVVVVERTAKGVWKARADGRAAVRARVRIIIVAVGVVQENAGWGGLYSKLEIVREMTTWE